MSGPYHVHEGKALQSTSLSLWEKAKNYGAGVNTTGFFPANTFNAEDIRWDKDTDRWGYLNPKDDKRHGVEILKGYYAAKEDDGETTYYQISFQCLGSTPKLKLKFNGLTTWDKLPEEPDLVPTTNYKTKK